MTTTYPNETRVYDQLRTIAERHGGRMWHVREGHRYGAWTVEIDGATRVFVSYGVGYPELDRLYVRKAVFPEGYTDYTDRLVEDAEPVFLEMVRGTR